MLRDFEILGIAKLRDRKTKHTHTHTEQRERGGGGYGRVEVRFAEAVNDSHFREREKEREREIRRLLFARGRIDANGVLEGDCHHHRPSRRRSAPRRGMRRTHSPGLRESRDLQAMKYEATCTGGRRRWREVMQLQGRRRRSGTEEFVVRKEVGKC